MTSHIGVHSKGKVVIADVLKDIKDKPDFQKVGAMAIFIGVARGETSTGETVKKLELEAYEEKANEVLENICRELRNKTGVIDVQIHHFLGEFDVGEDLVYVVVAGAHRQEVFSVLGEAVERFKREAPMFKKECLIGKNGKPRSRWVGEQTTS